MATVPNKFRPGSFRSSYEYLAGVPQISDELVEYFRRDIAPPDDVAERGEREIRAACAVLKSRREAELVRESVEMAAGVYESEGE